MTKNLFLEALNTFVSIIAIVCMIYLFFLLPGCQWLQEHPKFVEEVEAGAEKILEFELTNIAKNSTMHGALEAHNGH